MEFLLAIGALAGLCWATVICVRGGLVATALLVLLAGSCLGHPFFNLPAGPVPLTLDRMLLVVLLAQCVVYRRWGLTDPKPATKTDYLLVAFLIVLTVSTLTHDYRYRNWLPASQLIFFYFLPAAMYWVMRQTRWTAQGAGCLFASLGLFAVYLSITAMAETHQVWSLVYPKYIASPEYSEFLGRGRGPFLNPAANGMVLGLGMCAALMWWPQLRRRGKLLLLASLPVFAYGVYSTFTRSAWLGAGLGLLVVVALTTPRGWRLPVVGGAMLVSLAIVAGGWEHLVAFKRDKYVSVEDTAESARLRPILLVVAWNMFLDRPLLGCGYGQYIEESPAYLDDRTSDLPLEKARPYRQHNVWLSLLTETGLIGMGLFTALMFSWTRIAWQLWTSPRAPDWVRQMGLLFLACEGVYLPNAMFQDMSIIPMVNMILFFLAGAVFSLTPWLAAADAPRPLRVWEPEGELALAAH